MSHMAFDIRDNTLAPIFKALMISCIIYLLTAMNILVLTSAINMEMVLVVIAYITEDTGKSSWPEMKDLYSPLRPLKYSGLFWVFRRLKSTLVWAMALFPGVPPP